MDELDLRKPGFQATAAYGHFGRNGFSWEKTDKAAALKDAAGPGGGKAKAAKAKAPAARRPRARNKNHPVAKRLAARQQGLATDWRLASVCRLTTIRSPNAHARVAFFLCHLLTMAQTSDASAAAGRAVLFRRMLDQAYRRKNAWISRRACLDAAAAATLREQIRESKNTMRLLPRSVSGHRRGKPALARIVRDRMATRPLPKVHAWWELGLAQWLYDRAGFFQLSACVTRLSGTTRPCAGRS